MISNRKFKLHPFPIILTYFINRMPSAYLGGEVPLRRLKPDTHLFILPSRGFGCVAFVQGFSPGLDKLS